MFTTRSVNPSSEATKLNQVSSYSRQIDHLINTYNTIHVQIQDFSHTLSIFYLCSLLVRKCFQQKGNCSLSKFKKMNFLLNGENSCFHLAVSSPHLIRMLIVSFAEWLCCTLWQQHHLEHLLYRFVIICTNEQTSYFCLLSNLLNTTLCVLPSHTVFRKLPIKCT